MYDVTEWCVSEDFAVLVDMLQPTLDEIEAVGAQGGVMTGFTDLDRLLNGLPAGRLVIVAGRPGLGKSTVSMDLARNSAIRRNCASAIFSLELSKVEIVVRLLSAEARVPLHVLRSGSCPMATGRNWPAEWGEQLAFGDLVRMLFQASGFRL
ncbi:hypothetical protein GCM10023170_082620 [Phytohabitans houttuyneae]|uniref:SF4 helicase domain-containing protein n=1 Tax=Phytohabitans houttuyneae TaxID=1076126 RepID=A0A6V8KJ07_9ACTN|nr:hypothetical protein Phou_061360 [Phytohabitans houttuyneae]